MSSPDQSFLQSVVLLIQLLELSAGGCSLHSRVTDLLLDDLQVYGQLLHLLLQILRLHLQTLTLHGEEEGGMEGGWREGGITGGIIHEHIIVYLCTSIQFTRECMQSPIILDQPSRAVVWD